MKKEWKKGEYIFGAVVLLLAITLVSAIGSTNYNISNPTIASGDNLSSASYATGVVIGDISDNVSSASYSSCVGFLGCILAL